MPEKASVKKAHRHRNVKQRRKRCYHCAAKLTPGPNCPWCNMLIDFQPLPKASSKRAKA